MYTTASGIQIPQGPDAFSPTPQFKDWADGEAVFDNFVNVNLDSERTALAPPKLRDGVFCWVRTTAVLWTYRDSTLGWVPASDPVVGTVTPAAGYSIIGATLSRVGKMATLSMHATGATWVGGVKIATLSAGFAPPAGTIVISAATNLSGVTVVPSAVQISDDGTVHSYVASDAGELYVTMTWRVA